MKRWLTLAIFIAFMSVVLSAQTLTSGNVLQLDGSGDYMAADTSPANFGTGDFTIEAWIKTTNGSGTIFSNRNSDSYSNFFTFFLNGGGKLTIEISQDGSGTNYAVHVGNGTVHNGEWRHVAFVRNGSTIEFFIDGVLDKTITTTAVDHSSVNPFYVGARGGGYVGMLEFFNGMIDDVRLWNLARTQTEISSAKDAYVSSSASGLVANYRFDENSGSTASCAVSGTYNGTLYGNAQFSNTPLPVELTTFTAQPRESAVELRWSTATEVNNHGFEVERRAMDNGHLIIDNWTKAGFVEGNGNSHSPKEYSYTDHGMSAGKYSYRLKQIDRDGKFEYSKEVEVTVASAPSKFELSQNYPNPFNPSTTIGFTLQNSGMTTLKVYDAIGREVATLANEYLEAGVYHQRTFDASSFSSGIYLARLQNGTAIQIKKMVLMK